MIKLGTQNKSTLKVGSQFNLTEQYKKQVTENTVARHTHENKNVLDGITEEKLKKWDKPVTFVNFTLEEYVEEAVFSFAGTSDRSFVGVLELLNAKQMVVGKKDNILYTPISWDSEMVRFKGFIDKDTISYIDMRPDLGEYTVVETRETASSVVTKSTMNGWYRAGDLIIAPTSDYNIEFYRVVEDFRCDGTKNVTQSPEIYTMSIADASYAFQAGVCEHAEAASNDDYGNFIPDTYATKPTVYTFTSSTISMPIGHNMIFNCSEVTTMTLNAAGFILNNAAWCSLTFETGAAGVNFTMLADDVRFAGADCADDNFIPLPNKMYNIIFTVVRDQIWASVESREVISE